MNAQLFQVLGTYTRRPLVRLIAAVALLIAIGLFAIGFIPGGANISIAPEIDLTDRAAVSTETYDDYFQNHSPAELDSLWMTDFASMLTLDPNGGEFPDLTPLVNLSILMLNSSDFTRPKLEEVQSLENLEALTLQAPSIPKGTWTALGPKLRELEVPVRLLLSHPGEVSQLVELQMLRVNRAGLTSEALSVIARIPNLKYLVLSSRLTDNYAETGRPQPVSAFLELSPETLRPLAGHPSLEAIFAHWPPQIPRTIPALPGIQLYPSGFPTIWQSAMLLGLFFTAAIAIIVALQAWTHFVVQTAAVVPGYARPHQLAGIIVLVGGGLVGAAGLWWSGIAMLPGVVLALAIPTAILAYLNALQSKSRIVVILYTALAFLAGAIFWLPMAMMLSLPPAIAGELVWFLRGDFTLVAVLILFGECALLGSAIFQLPKLVHRVYERSPLRPGLSPWDPQQQRRTTYGYQNRWMGLLDRGEQYARLRGDSHWRKTRLWRAGNAFRARNAILFGGMFIVFYIALQMLMSGRESLSDPMMWNGCMAQLGGFALLLPAAAWGRRCDSLQVESLRPVGRKDLVRQLFTALALDQSLALVPFAIAIVISIAFPRQGGSVAESYSFLALGLAALVWVYVLSTAVFAFKRAWILAGYLVAMIVFPIACLTGFAIIADVMKVPDGRQILLIYVVSLAFLVVAIGILGATYSRSLRREWG